MIYDFIKHILYSTQKAAVLRQYFADKLLSTTGRCDKHVSAITSFEGALIRRA